MYGVLALSGTWLRPGRRARAAALSPGGRSVGWEGKLSLAGQFRWAMLAAGS